MAMAGGETMAAGFYAGVTADGGAEDLGFGGTEAQGGSELA